MSSKKKTPKTESPREPQPRKPTWYTDAKLLAETVDAHESAQKSDLTIARAIGRAFWNRPLVAEVAPDINYRDSRSLARAQNTLLSEFGFNLTREVIEAFVARVCRPLSPKVVSVAGDSKLRQQVVKQTRFLSSQFHEVKVRQVLLRMALDACGMRGFGAGKVYLDPDTGDEKFSQLDCMGVFVPYQDDPIRPERIFTKQAISKEYLCDVWGEQADQIWALPEFHQPFIAGVEPTTTAARDTVCVYEGWKLARGDKPGRHVMCAGNVVLVDEPYEADYHEVILLRFSPEYRGAGGVALGRQLIPYHRWKNQLVKIIHDSLRGAVPRILRRTDTIMEKLGEIPFQDVQWDGVAPPQIDVPNPVSDQVIAQSDRVSDGAFRETGVSQHMAGGQIPAGVTSGQAIRDYAGFADDRLQSPTEYWKEAHCDVAKPMLGMAAEAYSDRSIMVRAPGSDFLEEIRWQDIDIKRDRFRVEFDVASALSGTVTDKLQQVQDIQDRGAADALTAMRMIREAVPDVAAYVDRVTAPLAFAEKVVDDALNGIVTPIPACVGQDALNYIQLIGVQMYCKALVDRNRTPEELEVLRKVIRMAQRKQAKPLPPMTPVPSAPSIAPGGIQPAGFVPRPGPAPAPTPSAPIPPPAQ